MQKALGCYSINESVLAVFCGFDAKIQGQSYVCTCFGLEKVVESAFLCKYFQAVKKFCGLKIPFATHLESL
jgi:hypothetical protein